MKRMHTDEEIQKLAASPIGDVSIEGDLEVDGDFEANSVSADSIIENMSGYSFTPESGNAAIGLDLQYVGVVKTGNKLTFVLAGNMTRNADTPFNRAAGKFTIPLAVSSKLIANDLGAIDNRTILYFNSATNYKTLTARMFKTGQQTIQVQLFSVGDSALTINTAYYWRYEATFLLSENMIS